MNFRLIVSLAACCAITTALNPFISVTRNSIDYTKTAAAQDEFYVATSAAPDNQSNALSRCVLTRNSDGSNSLAFVDLVPEKTRVNGVMGDNPIYSQFIGSLASYQNVPLVAYGSNGNTVHSVALVQDALKGASLLVNTQPFSDALGAPTRNIVQLAAGVPSHFAQGFVFAAVSPSNATTCAGQSAAGIGVAQITSHGIVPFDAYGRNSGPFAAPLTDDLIAVNGAGSISGVTALCWNSVLNKLFVALDVSGGGTALVVGSLDIPTSSKITGNLVPSVQLSLQPCIVGVDGTNADVDWDDDDFVVVSSGSSMRLQSLGIMNASTGYSYAVVSREDTKVYAVPLVSDSKSNQLGMLAQKNDSTKAATLATANQLLRIGNARVVVGGEDAPDTITSLAVYGDSVFISCAGSDDTQRGVFVSQALFDTAGMVRGWSQWQCVLCASKPVYGFCRDLLGRIKFLSASAGDRNTIGNTVWGRGHNNGLWGGTVENRRIGLVDQLNTFFSAESGGVQSLISFTAGSDSQRWGHTSERLATGNSLLIATGRNRCALALTAKGGDVTKADQFMDPDFYAQYVMDDLNLGSLTAAALSRGSGGWLFVGGSNGVAVLSKSDGDGWGQLNDLNDLEGMSFHLLKKPDGSSFSQVRQLLSDENALYIFADDGVYRAEYDSNAFQEHNPDVLVSELIASPEFLCGDRNETIISGLLEGDYLFLATSRGLRVNNVVLTAVENNTGEHGWGLITLTPGGTDSFGVCAQLSFIPSAATEGGGTLIVLTADVALNVATAYRIDIPNAELPALAADELGAVVHTIDTSVVHTSLLGQFREYLYIDGGIMIDAASIHHRFTAEGTGVVRILPVSRRIGSIDAWGESVQPVFDESVTINTIAGIVRDLATGTIIVPGVWGIQILQ